jgi:low affinity Fe/Cu permease
MRTSHKVLLTLLISLLITGGFAVLAYTGLFRVLETDFFSERVKEDQLHRLEAVSSSITAWNEDNRTRFDSLTRDRNFQTVYSVTQREEEITARARTIDALQDRLAGFIGIRVVDIDGRLQYSSFAGDVGSEQVGERRLYRNWDQLDNNFTLPAVNDDSEIITLFDGSDQQVIYLIPSPDRTFIIRGWMVVYLNPAGLGRLLAGDGITSPGGMVQVVDSRGLIVDIRPEQAEAVSESIDTLWPDDGVPAEFAMLAQSPGENFWLATTVASDGTWIGKLIPGRLLGFSQAVQILILGTVFVTVSLMMFLILNIRQDRTEILRSRIKRLQVNLLRDWLEHHEDRQLKLSDLESRREEVRRELRSGLGPLRGSRLEKADKIIDEGWTRIVEILGEKELVKDGRSAGTVSSEAPQPPIDMKQLEDMITRAVAEAKVVVPPEVLSGLQAPPAQAPIAPSPGRPIKVEVVGDDEVEELDELEELSEVEELAEVEEIDELDEVEELSEVEELAEVEEIDELDEVEELSEVEELTEVEEVPEVEDVEELAEVEEIDELDEVEELSEVEELTEAEEVSEFVEPEELEKEPEEQDESITVEGRLKSVERDSEEDFADNLEELESAEELEELKTDEEIEETLEVLPVVLSDDSRELIEIDKVDQDRLYMFDKEFKTAKDSSEGEDIAELQEVEDNDGELEELEELVEDGSPDDAAEKESTGVDSVQFIAVDEVLKSVRKAEAEAEKTQGESDTESVSMESLIMTHTSDILPGLDEIDEEFSFGEDSPVLNWFQDGLDYDRYLLGFKKGATGIYKSLMSLSKEYNAICGVLLAGSRKGLETDYAVGLDDDSATQLSVNRAETIWDEWFNQREIIFVPKLSESKYADKTRHNEFRFIKSAIFIPATYRGAPPIYSSDSRKHPPIPWL